MTIPPALLYALVPVVLTGGLTFAAWLVRETGKLAESQAATAQRLDGIDKRTHRLEAWYDGIQVGRWIERANPESHEPAG